MHPLVWGLVSLVLVSVLFEPIRMSLWRLGEEVGGVGGVGGLTNQFSCGPEDTTTPYCFRRGVVLGFTPFAAVVLLLYTLPLAVAAWVAGRSETRTNDRDRDRREVGSSREDRRFSSTDVSNSTEEEVVLGTIRARPKPKELMERNAKCVSAFSVLLACVSCLWFSVPLAYYANSPFYQESVWHFVLAVAIVAAFPLSWHLALVAIPSAGAALLAPQLGLPRAALKGCHVRAAWAALFWGCLHGGGELVYLTATNQLGLVWIGGGRSGAEADNGTFVFGLVTLVVLLALATHAKARKTTAVKNGFRRLHRMAAGILLLVAAAHWWPFALFLAPAVAVAATGHELDRASPEDAPEGGAARTSAGTRRTIKARNGPFALAAAILAALAGIAPTWAARQAWMLAHPSQYYTLPTMLFPPAAVGVAYALARVVAGVVLRGSMGTGTGTSSEDSSDGPMVERGSTSGARDAPFL